MHLFRVLINNVFFQVTQLKIRYNPFAKAFQDARDRPNDNGQSLPTSYSLPRPPAQLSPQQTVVSKANEIPVPTPTVPDCINTYSETEISAPNSSPPATTESYLERYSSAHSRHLRRSSYHPYHHQRSHVQTLPPTTHTSSTIVYGEFLTIRSFVSSVTCRFVIEETFSHNL